MPDFGQGVPEVKILRWFVREGDRVDAGVVLCEILTGEAATEVRAPVSGRIELRLAVEDQLVPTAAPLCRIKDDEPDHLRSTDPPRHAETTSGVVPEVVAEENERAGKAESDSAMNIPEQDADPFAAAVSSAVAPVESVDTPRATLRMQLPDPLERSQPLHAHVSEVSEPLQPVEQQTLHAHVSEAVAPPPPPEPALHAHVAEDFNERVIEPQHTSKPRAKVTAAGEKRLSSSESLNELKPEGNRRGVLSPAVQNLAAEYGINLEKIIGSGEKGEVTERDVLTAAASRSLDHPVPSLSAPGFACIEIDCTRIRDAFDIHRADFMEHFGFELSLTPFYALAVCNSLLEFPSLNARIDQAARSPDRSSQVILQMIKITSNGAIRSCTLKNAEKLTLRQIEKSAHEGDDSGAGAATFVLHDLGEIGLTFSIPSLESGLSAALSIGVPRFNESRDGSIGDVPRVLAAAAWHRDRVTDVEAYAFLAGFKERIEEWDWVTLAG